MLGHHENRPVPALSSTVLTSVGSVTAQMMPGRTKDGEDEERDTEQLASLLQRPDVQAVPKPPGRPIISGSPLQPGPVTPRAVALRSHGEGVLKGGVLLCTRSLKQS